MKCGRQTSYLALAVALAVIRAGCSVTADLGHSPPGVAPPREETKVVMPQTGASAPSPWGP